jgi:hypothetical protein
LNITKNTNKESKISKRMVNTSFYMIKFRTIDMVINY